MVWPWHGRQYLWAEGSVWVEVAVLGRAVFFCEDLTFSLHSDAAWPWQYVTRHVFVSRQRLVLLVFANLGREQAWLMGWLCSRRSRRSRRSNSLATAWCHQATGSQQDCDTNPGPGRRRFLRLVPHWQQTHYSEPTLLSSAVGQTWCYHSNSSMPIEDVE